jgi:hypothetical protein
MLEVGEKRNAEERQEKEIRIEGRRMGSGEWTDGYEEWREEENIILVTDGNWIARKEGSFERPEEGKWRTRNQPFSLRVWGGGRRSAFSGGSDFTEINRLWNFEKTLLENMCETAPLPCSSALCSLSLSLYALLYCSLTSRIRKGGNCIKTSANCNSSFVTVKVLCFNCDLFDEAFGSSSGTTNSKKC